MDWTEERNRLLSESRELFQELLVGVLLPSIRDAEKYYPYGKAAAKYRKSLLKDAKKIIADIDVIVPPEAEN